MRGTAGVKWSAKLITIGVVTALALLGGGLAVWYQFVRLPARAPTPRSVPVLATGASAGERPLFDLTDPAGDDRGPGSYYYPRDPMFVAGLFDLRRFTVTYDAQSIHFRLTFGALTNPWGAPEGFYHQRVDIYLDTEAGEGRTAPLRPGANVRFTERYAWDYLVRVAPWKGSRVERAKAGGVSGASGTSGISGASGVTGVSGAQAEAEVEAQAVAVAVEDGKTLHLTVPRAALPARPSRRWRYYVLVGGYDAFGPDEYRPVTGSGGRWVFGGGQDSNLDPNVLDLLAPRFGRHSQSRQLAAMAGSPARGGTPTKSAAPATLYPVGGR